MNEINHIVFLSQMVNGFGIKEGYMEFSYGHKISPKISII